MILIGVEKRGLAFAKSVQDADWTCRIDEGLAGLAHCRWAPTSRHILTISEFKLRLTIWSLIDQSVQYIPFPKHESTGIDFSPDGTLMAVALKGDDMSAPGKMVSDVIAVYSVNQGGPWECLIKFAADTADLYDLKFSRDGSHIIAWDSPLNAKVQVFKIFGNSRKILAVQSTAALMPEEIAPSKSVGVVEVNRNRSFVFVGHFDEHMRMYNTLSWREMFAFDHSLPELTEFNSSEILNIYYENESPDGIYYEALNRPFKVPRASATQYLTDFGAKK